MPSIDWKALPSRIRERAGAAPRWIWPAAAIGALTGGLLILFLSGGPAYAPLFDGLSARSGGQVIARLQKLGIPYRLSANGSVISVPAPQLGQARLELGKSGVPADSGSRAWEKLTDGSLTSSQYAEDALRKRALEESLENAIAGIQGIASARVTLAIPASTPFLGDQPHPKASVWLETDTAGISGVQARAIAQLVASAVPGLQARRVTVTDQHGDLLAPAGAGVGQAQQQLAFQDRIEAEAAAHIQALLDPVVGPDNLRVSVAADVDFSRARQQAVRYGPKRQADQLQQVMDSQNGTGKTPKIPGALSNQPPGNASAPLSTTSGKGKNGGQGRNGGKKNAQPRRQSRNDSWNVHYDVDQETSVTRTPGWAVKALSVSIVLNKTAVGKAALARQVKAIVNDAITAPHLRINVASVPFGLQRGVAPAWKQALGSPSLIRAGMELIAAIALLFGIARPLARWLASRAPTSAPNARLQLAPAGTPVDLSAESTDQKAAERQRAREAVSSQPEEVADLLKGWLRDPASVPADDPLPTPAPSGGESGNPPDGGAA